jgi:hypothetical protein
MGTEILFWDYVCRRWTRRFRYKPTPCRRGFQKLTVGHLIKKFPPFRGIKISIPCTHELLHLDSKSEPGWSRLSMWGMWHDICETSYFESKKETRHFVLKGPIYLFRATFYMCRVIRMSHSSVLHWGMYRSCENFSSKILRSTSDFAICQGRPGTGNVGGGKGGCKTLFWSGSVVGCTPEMSRTSVAYFPPPPPYGVR